MATSKPVKKTRNAAFDYHEVMKYIQNKYGFDVRDYKGKFKGKAFDPNVEYCDFWHWYLDKHEVHNGCYSSLWLGWIDEPKTPDWVKEILVILRDEFSPDGEEIDFWIAW